jgi:hypothetical protein
MESEEIRFSHEMDFRRNWISTLYEALSRVIHDIGQKLEEHGHYDGIDALEDPEWILGIAFIAAQTYITGTIADLKAVLSQSSSDTQKVSKKTLLLVDVISIADGVTPLQLIDAIANYQKHHDEWEDWQVDDKNRSTIEILENSGINKDTEFPCYKAATLLWPESRVGELSYLLNLLEDWRSRVIRKYKPLDSD